jgi:L-fucose mutarotase
MLIFTDRTSEERATTGHSGEDHSTPRGDDRIVLLTELIHPGILEALAGAGHGARVLLADGHYPASTATTVAKVLLRVLPVEAAQVMVPPAGTPEPAAIAEYRTLLAPVPVEPLDRFAFYDAARGPDLALAVVTGDVRTYANLLLTIGVRQMR